jgi:excisionase family DNA binding protein
VTISDLDDLLSIDEAAALLKVTESAVRSWLSKKRLPRVKAGRRTLISRQSLVTFLMASQSSTQDATDTKRSIEESR